MRKREQRLAVRALIMGGDAAAVALSFGLAYWLRFEVQVVAVTKGIPPVAEYIKLVAAGVVIWAVVIRTLNLYQPEYHQFRASVFTRLGRACFLSAVLLSAAAFFYRGAEYSRAVVVLVAGVSWGGLTAFRAAMWQGMKALHRRQFALSNILIVGAGKLGEMVARQVSDPAYGFRVVGFLDDDLARGSEGTVLGATQELKQVIQRHEVDEVILTLPFRARDRIMELALECETLYVPSHVVPDFYELLLEQVEVQTIRGVPLMGFKQIPLSGWHLATKQAFDAVVSVAMLVLLAPFMGAIALLVKMTSPGPVFYRQERVGRDGRTFLMYKFRTMRQDAEAQTGAVWAQEDDPRRTPIGRWLRRWSVDELPQLFHVLRGEMSLVGPRPERPIFVEQFQSSLNQYFVRHKVKSGLTGWAQVNGLRGNTSIEERTRYDLFYVEQWSLALDCKILLMTLGQVFLGKNAY